MSVPSVTVGAPVTRLCEAKTRAGGKCRRPAGWGTDHVGYGRCKLHAGNAPSGRRAAFRAKVLEEAHLRLGMAIDVDPGEAAMACIAEAAANVRVLRGWLGLLAEPDADDTTGTVGSIYEAIVRGDGDGGTYETGEAKPHVLWVMYAEERARLFDMCKTAISLGLREREVRLAERQAQPLAEAFVAVLAAPELGLTPAQQDSARRLLAGRLRALTAGPATAAEPTVPASATQRPVRALDPRPSTTTPEEGA